MRPMNKAKLCLSAAEVSEKTGISLSSVRKLTRYGKLPHIRIGRRILYPITGIEEWLTQNTIGITTPNKGGDNNGT